MSPLPRRSFLNLTATGALLGLSHSPGRAQTPAATPAPPIDEDGVTRRLAQFLVSVGPDEVPAPVRKEATRTLVNWAGVAVGGSRHESVDRALAAIAPFAGPAQAQVFGRRERLDVPHATLLNGISSHVLNFDDTHLKSVIHASSAIVPPALALAEFQPEITGRDLRHALVLGMETAFRLGLAVSPNHFDVGWHITGTAGAIGAAAACGRLLRLTEQQMRWALGLAASQPVGLRESFGSMNKSFNPGRAGQNGLLAALLAARNFTSSDRMLEAVAGWARTLSTKQDFRAITDGLGTHYETAFNTYLPFACAIIMHPAIDGCLRLRAADAPRVDEIRKIELRVHRRVLELSGNPAPRTGLEGKFSIHHATAVALIAGRAGPRQFSDEAVRDPATVALRQRIVAIIDPAVTDIQAGVSIELTDGRVRKTFVAQAVGSVENPLGDAALTTKATDLMEGLLPGERIHRLVDACWQVESLPSASALARLGAA